jgi:DNA-binding response OmpR family regulator
VSPAETRILVLEDEPFILTLVEAALQSGGFERIALTGSVEEARAAWRAASGQVDLLITDFSLPDGSAPDFIEELLAEKPSLTIFLMTGFSEDMLDLRGLRKRITLLQKPFRPSDLRDQVLASLPAAMSA